MYGLVVILACLWLGEAMNAFFDLPIPSAVLGMLLLLSLLLIRGQVSPGLAQASHWLLRYMSLFFVPAGVGVVLYLTELYQHGWALVAALVISTLLGLVVTGWTFQRLAK